MRTRRLPNPDPTPPPKPQRGHKAELLLRLYEAEVAALDRVCDAMHDERGGGHPYVGRSEAIRRLILEEDERRARRGKARERRARR